MNTDDQNPSSEDQDLNLLEINLSLTPEERIIKHQNALNLVNELKRAIKDAERSELSSESSSRS